MDAQGKIYIRPFTDFWGPFSFDASDAIPENDTLTASTTVQSFLDDAETTDELIEAGSILINGGNILLRLQYPGATLHGKHVLRFNLVLGSGAQHTLAFKYAHVID